ncbi:flagellar motor protein MotA [Alkalilimnicola ehrlichii]|uniref:Flagellar motor protein MotA n=1 Tax=Alkalilimnicola ehrlichii TaxID=351052 RepID=A0A3E0WLV4_9GAMM|nr:MotA/TolQ/ExbB proton channel family protein [Alkalilimnicola ehrlichii]RFA26837.1 flagellar motor protein MotA [Alkalilimnicola ehrlichii]RFA33932.1 flagellar motor protein MotA [Alkalilimnicola ehrlichii]
MFDSGLIVILNQFVGWLLQPVLIALSGVVLLAVWEIGLAVGERAVGLKRLQAGADSAAVERMGRRRIERADLIARIGPMLGLMGTLIPLGPGLAALGRGELEVLAQALTVAFDTTVLGLLAGIVGFLLGRLRRRWYDQVLDALETDTDATAHAAA